MRLLVLFLALSFIVPNTSWSADLGLGDIINQVTDGIKPEAFKGKFAGDMDSWKETTSALGVDDVDAAKAQLGGLLGGLKGSAFSSGAKSQLMTKLAGINGIDGIKDFLGSMLSGLNPAMLTDKLLGNKDMLMGAIGKL